MRLTAVAASLVALGATSACTTTRVSGIDESVTTYAIGKVSIGLAAGAEARRAKWIFSDPDPCWTGGGDLDEAESQD